MTAKTTATMFHCRDTHWTFLQLGDQMLAYNVLDRAENALHGRDDFDELEARCKDNGDRLELGEVEYTGEGEDAEFESLTVTA